MKWSHSAVTLAILLLILVALMLRGVDFPAYSPEEIKTELSALCDEYAELSARGAGEAEWQAFEQEAEKKLEPLVAEMKSRGGSSWLSQLALHELPRAIDSRGKRSNLNAFLTRDDERRVMSQNAMTPPQTAPSIEQQSDGGVDLWLISMVVLDGGLVIALAYMLCRPVRRRFFVPKDMDLMLRQLDKRIERNPDAVRFLAARARLLADAGRHQEAIADIDRIVDQHAHGVNVEKWRQLRETLMRKTAEGN